MSYAEEGFLIMRSKRKYNVTSTSHFKGVSWCNTTNKWRVVFLSNKKQVHVGRFYGEVEAAEAYDKAIYALHHDRNLLNFPSNY